MNLYDEIKFNAARHFPGLVISDDLRIRAGLYADEDADHSYLGEFRERFTWEPATGIYDRQTGLMFDGSKWRDARGHFATPPDDLDPDRRECRFIDIGTCQFTRADRHWLKYAFQNARRLEGLASGNWCYVGLRLELLDEDDEIIASSSGVWGIESNSGRDYFEEVAREELSSLEADYLAVAA